jgi:hypothetical protein
MELGIGEKRKVVKWGPTCACTTWHEVLSFISLKDYLSGDKRLGVQE